MINLKKVIVILVFFSQHQTQADKHDKFCLNVALENLKHIATQKQSLVQALLKSHNLDLDRHEKQTIIDASSKSSVNFNKVHDLLKEIPKLIKKNHELFTEEFILVEKVMEKHGDEFQFNEKSLLEDSMKNFHEGLRTVQINLEDLINNVMMLIDEDLEEDPHQGYTVLILNI